MFFEHKLRFSLLERTTFQWELFKNPSFQVVWENWLEMKILKSLLSLQSPVLIKFHVLSTEIPVACKAFSVCWTKKVNFLLYFIYFQWSPRDPEAGGQVSAVWPGPAGSGEGHHDLHAPDQVHVQQPSKRAAAAQQEAESVRNLLCTAKSPQTVCPQYAVMKQFHVKTEQSHLTVQAVLYQTIIIINNTISLSYDYVISKCKP